jgi:hypothetical protein
MVTEDDRTPEQLASHYWLIVGTDRFMSGWGGARGGASVAAWACKPEHSDKVARWVESREDMRRVREVSEWCYRCGGNGKGTVGPAGRCSLCAGRGRNRYRPRSAAHFHVYVVEEGHPALA